MPTNQDVLDAGVPDLPDPIPDDGSLDEDAERYGNAIRAVDGTEGSPTNLGSYLRRIPETVTGAALAANQLTTADPGTVTAVAGDGTTPLTSMPYDGSSPPSGGVAVEYLSDGRARLRTNAGDGFSTLNYQILVTPSAMISALDATSDPP